VVAEARRKAWDLAAAGDPGVAARTLRDALNDVDKVERGWRLEEVAAYQHEVDTQAAQGTLKAAKQANKNTMMPTIALAAKPVKGRALHATAASEYLVERYSDGTTLQLGVQSMLDDLAFGPGQERVEAAEAAMRELGRHLGFSATRPEKETTRGPDGCWGLTPTTNAVIELKTGTERADTDIIKAETDQLAGASPGTRRLTTQTYAFRYSSPRALGFTHWPARLQEPGSSPRRASSSSRTTSARSPARLPSIEAGGVRRL
jgi:hypothetical protein